MSLCAFCKEQMDKTQRGKPHHYLSKINEERIFAGAKPRGYQEQDYQCQVCQSKFTWSSNRNDLTWTLWQV